LNLAGLDVSFRRAVTALQTGDLTTAERSFKDVLRTQPRHAAALNLLAVLLIKVGRFAEAEPYLKRALADNPKSDSTLYNYGISLKALNRHSEALECFTRALILNPGVPETWNNRGTVLNDLKRHEQALADFEKAIQLNPQYTDGLCNKGKSLFLLKRFAESLSAYQTASTISANLADAWLGQGHALRALKQIDDALAAYEKALSLRPNFAEAWVARGDIHAEFRRYDAALASYDKALAAKPHLPNAWLGRGNSAFALGKYSDALAAYDGALHVQPEFAEAWFGRGSVLSIRRRYEDALAAYDHALALSPDFAEASFARGNVFFQLRRYEDALAAYDKAITLNRELDYAKGARLLCKLFISDWSEIESQIAEVLNTITEERQLCDPFVPLLVSPSVDIQSKCARYYAENRQRIAPVWRGEVYSHDRIRVAYLSADFHEHATGVLAAGMFESHDRTRFEVTGLSFGPSDNSTMRNRIAGALERFVDVRERTDLEIANLIRTLEIDIAVDLKGFTDGHRVDVFARRAAPIQVNYLGYPGTMGADFIDYILADPTIIPEEHCAQYAEQVVWLPHSYQINDAQRRISQHTPTRRECGLPEDAFVFCCFNVNLKIMPEIFGVWMDLLRVTGNGVLWLLATNTAACANLRREAEMRGISADRLIFAPRTNLADHLARHQLADLFLDTLPYNAHTTASDALWAGLPVLTCLGTTFAGRVAASLLAAIGLNELVARSIEEYASLAFKLAHDPGLLASIRRKLALNRGTAPLFDTVLSTRAIEAAYLMMWERYQRGERLHVPSHRPVVVS
jgi:protein O-GlcNAc transferase